MEKPRATKTIDDMSVGDRIERSYVISDDDISTFARISGDYNPVHFDDAYASRTIFKRRIAHGMISLAKFSGIFGMDMPGLGTLWLNQTVTFSRPVFIGDEYKAIAEILSIDRRQVTVATWVEDHAGERVLTGEGVVIPISSQAKARLGI